MKSDADWDAVIVGAGAGGAAAAYGLCQRGMSVLLLDAGPRFDPVVDYPLTESNWDTRDFPEKAGSVGSVTFAPGQKLIGVEPLLVSGSKGLGLLVTSGTRWMEKYHHVRGIGGTTLHFTGEVPPPSPRCDENEEPFRRCCRLAVRLRRTGTILHARRRTHRRRRSAVPRCALALAEISLAAPPSVVCGPHIGTGSGGARARLASQQPRCAIAAVAWTSKLQLLRRLQHGLSAR